MSGGTALTALCLACLLYIGTAAAGEPGTSAADEPPMVTHQEMARLMDMDDT